MRPQAPGDQKGADREVFVRGALARRRFGIDCGCFGHLFLLVLRRRVLFLKVFLVLEQIFGEVRILVGPEDASQSPVIVIGRRELVLEGVILRHPRARTKASFFSGNYHLRDADGRMLRLGTGAEVTEDDLEGLNEKRVRLKLKAGLLKSKAKMLKQKYESN